jgi:hypothetical protein
VPSRRLFKKKRARVMTTARNRRPPMIAPAITPADVPACGVDDSVCLFEEVGEEVPVPVEPEPGGFDVELGDELLRQELSSEEPAIFTSELPPVRPWASNI